MITISFLGLDVFVAEHVSRDHQEAIAKLLGTNLEDILFYAPESLLISNGVEQTSWHSLVRVNAPKFFEKHQEKLAKYLITALRKHVLNVSVEFYYFDTNQRVDFIDKDYPRFITESNSVTPMPVQPENKEDLYQEDIFKEVKLTKNDEEKSCCQEGFCEGEEENCSCTDGKCDCNGTCEDEHHHK